MNSLIAEILGCIFLGVAFTSLLLMLMVAIIQIVEWITKLIKWLKS